MWFASVVDWCKHQTAHAYTAGCLQKPCMPPAVAGASCWPANGSPSALLPACVAFTSTFQWRGRAPGFCAEVCGTLCDAVCLSPSLTLGFDSFLTGWASNSSRGSTLSQEL